jgi:hypothetical protein
VTTPVFEPGFFYAPLLTLLDQALKSTFQNYTTSPDFADLHISVEYPVDRGDYPSIWVDFEPEGNLQTMGINRHEIDPSLLAEDPALLDDISQYQRWSYRGYATYTIGTLSSFERARLTDEIIRIMAFGSENPDTATFRQTIEDNPYIGCNFDFDSLTLRGKGEAMRTDWEAQAIVYEITVAMGCFGEFISDKHTGTLAILRKFNLFPWPQGEGFPDPFPLPASDWT